MKKIFCLLMIFVVVMGLGVTALAAEHEEDDPRVILQDGQGNEETVWFQGLYTLPECEFTAPEGQRFKCWRVDDRKNMQPGEQVYTDLRTVITAVWEPLPVVTFEADGGDGTMETVATEGEYALPECGFTAPESQQFKCWLVNGEEKQVGDTITVEADMTVTASWEQLPVVSFDAGDGSGEMDAVAIAGEYTLPECDFTAPEGQQFKCWKVDGEEVKPGDEITVSEDVTVEAVWEDIPTKDREESRRGADEEESAADIPWGIIAIVAVVAIAVGITVPLLIMKKKS